MAEHLRLQQQENLLDDSIDGQRHLRRVGLLGECANSLNDLSCAIAIVDHAFHGGAHLVEVRHIASEPAQARAAIGDDGSKRLVDFGGARSRQLSQSRDASDVCELCLHIAQRLFGLICADRRGYVGGHAPITEEVDFCVKEWLAARSKVNRRSVPAYGAVHEIAKRLMCVERRPVKPPFFGPRFDVGCVIPAGQANSARGLAAGRIEVLPNTGETVVATGFPKPIGGRFSVVAKPLLALPLRLLGPFPVLDIDARSIPFDDISDHVAQRYVMDQLPAIHSISPPQSGFILERCARRYGGAPSVHVPLTIFRLVYGLQALAAEIFQSETVVLHPTLIDEIDGAVRHTAHDRTRNGVKSEPEAFL